MRAGTSGLSAAELVHAADNEIAKNHDAELGSRHLDNPLRIKVDH
jgi:hypothetical protein